MANFPPIFVINLKRTPERRLHMQRQLDALSLSYQFIDAIDKVDLESSQYRSKISCMLGIKEAILDRKYAAIINRVKTEEGKNWKNAGMGQLAITLSHIKVYDLMAKNGIDWACILEDDAKSLPTFLEVLKIAPKLEWDILLLANNSVRSSYEILKNPIKRVRISDRDLIFLSHRLKKNPSSQKGKDCLVKCLLEEYGFNSRIYPKQSESFVNAIKEYDNKYAEIAKTIMPANRHWSLVKHEQYIKYRTLHRYLKRYILMQFGALPEKTSLASITEHHCIAEPRYFTFSATAYLLKQPAAMEWKHEALVGNSLAIDDIPWHLYKNVRAKLRIITPPCSIPTHSSFQYSSRLK